MPVAGDYNALAIDARRCEEMLLELLSTIGP